MMAKNSTADSSGSVGRRIGSRPFFQSAWIVDDLDTAVQQWLATGVGPFYVFRNVVLDKIDHRGTLTSMNISYAMAQAGPMQIELVFQHDDRPSAYRDVYRTGESGFHHIGCIVEDYDAAVREYTSRGIELAAKYVSGDVRVAYVDARKQLGFMIEIVEDRPSVRDSHAKIREASLHWDGRDPIRESL
jgi:hypothetical protein